MISPPLTAWPANVFTPSRCAFESRPLRLEPSPFLCAIARLRLGFRVLGNPRRSAFGGCGARFGWCCPFPARRSFGGACRFLARGPFGGACSFLARGFGRAFGLACRSAGAGPLGLARGGGRGGRLDARPSDVRDLDVGEILAVARAAPVAALGLELEPAQLLAAHVREHLGGHLHRAESLLVENGLLGAQHQRFERHLAALLCSHSLDEQPLSLLDTILLAAGSHDRVHVLW